MRILPTAHTVGGVSAEAINRTQLEAPARETNYIEVAIHDDMSSRAITCRATARFQSTVDAEALATIPAFSAPAPP
jgi:hypothetical protein